MNRRNTYFPDYSIPPGWLLFERLTTEGESLSEFSNRADIDRLLLSRIIVGAEAIDNEVARKLHAATGVDADIWLTLEKDFSHDEKAME